MLGGGWKRGEGGWLRETRIWLWTILGVERGLIMEIKNIMEIKDVVIIFNFAMMILLLF